MQLSEAMDFVRERRAGVLVTHKRDGRPQLSNIVYLVGHDGVIDISITADRAKYANLQRDPRASLYVGREDFGAYVVVEADVETMPVAAQVDDPTVERLVAYYRSMQGEHPDWDDYRTAMVADRRCVARLTPRRAYGMLTR